MSIFWCEYLLREAKTRLYQQAKRQEDVIRVCVVYPHKVSFDAMSKALEDLKMSPQWAYDKLCEGSRIPRLDEALGVSA